MLSYGNLFYEQEGSTVVSYPGQYQHEMIIIHYKSPNLTPPPPPAHKNYQNFIPKNPYGENENETQLRHIAEVSSNLTAKYMPLISCDSTHFIRNLILDP